MPFCAIQVFDGQTSLTANAHFRLYDESPTSAKHDELETHFMQSAPFFDASGHRHQPAIVGIRRIENKTIQDQVKQRWEYLRKKHAVETMLELYHGTNCEILETHVYKDGLKVPSDRKASDHCPVSGGKVCIVGVHCTLRSARMGPTHHCEPVHY